MAVDTKGEISEKILETQMRSVIERIAEDVQFQNGTEIDSFKSYVVHFSYEGERRSLFVSMEKRTEVTSLNFGAWGKSVEIMHAILEFFGGHMIERDSDGDESWYYVAPSVGYRELTPKDRILQLIESDGLKLKVEKRLEVVDFILRNQLLNV